LADTVGKVIVYTMFCFVVCRLNYLWGIRRLLGRGGVLVASGGVAWRAGGVLLPTPPPLAHPTPPRHPTPTSPPYTLKVPEAARHNTPQWWSSR
jgi:hypothetical protein